MLGSRSMQGWGFQLEDAKVSSGIWPVSSNYLRFFNMDVVEGNDFSENNSDTEMIFNQAFVNEHGDMENIVGKKISFYDGGEGASVGVAKDYNLMSLHEPIKPTAFVTGERYSRSLSFGYVKIDGQNVPESIEYFSETWKKFSNDPVDITFLDATLKDVYKQENNLAKLISMCGLITIIVAIMGVYGLILFNVKSKRKTIALHKINGASVREVILMLNRGFIVQFAAAYIIAVPAAYIAVSRWLENFAYKTAIHW